jgi:formate hydrogenlyase transcriptional activator
MLVRAVPVRDVSGALVEWVGAHTDITAAKLADLQLRHDKDKLTGEKRCLEQEIKSVIGQELIGNSPALRQALEDVTRVAPVDSTVLLLGETGTGKELFARALHRLSSRQSDSFIKLNCAAIPSGLLESELFGHERGAFTGAITRKLGRIELADQGTLFLDEIGEVPLELQPKLLRVLQDHEFERLGSTVTAKVDFRLIAATNRDLEQCVQQKQFRQDLFYRLSVFPIRIPPLRDRRDDIPLLAEHFLARFGARLNKKITRIPAATMEGLMQWRWPGNVRELENFIERSVILTRGDTLQAPLRELLAGDEASAEATTLEAMERQHILRALRDSCGQLSGPNGAATRLGLPRSTLQSRLKHLGIDHHQFRSQ